MSEVLPPDLPGGLAGALGTLRHALADPLSAAGLKLELLERRLAAGPLNGLSLVAKARGAKADLATAGRLIGLLPRLGSIEGEPPSEVSVGDLCRVIGIQLEDDAASRPRLLLRRQASLDALRSVLWFLRALDPALTPPQVSAEASPGWVSLRIEGPHGRVVPNPEQLFHLPRGEERAEALFLARAGVELDGGRLELDAREGRLVAIFTWPLAATAGDAGAPP